MDLKNLKLLLSFLQNEDNSEVQKILNDLLDVSIVHDAGRVGGILTLPDIPDTYFTQESPNRWKPQGRFNASSGEFSDLRTLRRIDDIKVTLLSSRKYMGSCIFELAKASVHYDRYTLKYGVIEVKGRLTGSVNGLTVSLTIQYDGRRVTLQDLRVTRIDKIKVKLTGLGPLNRLTSKLISWITTKWKETLVADIERVLRKNVKQFFSNLEL